MVMDPRLRECYDSRNGIQLGNQPLPHQSNKNVIVKSRFETTFLDHNLKEFHCLPPDPSLSHLASSSSNITSCSSIIHEEDSVEDCDFSDAVLSYISQILMEEDMEEKTCMLQDSLDLQSAEKSFYDVLGKKYPPSPEPNRVYPSQSSESPNDYFSEDSINYLSTTSNNSAYYVDNPQIRNLGGGMPQIRNLPVHSVSQSSNSCSKSLISSVDGPVESTSSTLEVPESNNGDHSVWNFRKGVEEASKFLPSGNDFFPNLEAKAGNSEVVFKAEREKEGEFLPKASRGRKNHHGEDRDLEGERSSKQAAVFTESTVRSDMFDIVLLHSAGEGLQQLQTLREELLNTKNRSVLQNGQAKGSSRGKGRGKKPSRKKEVVDLRTLLIHCAQAVAADDHRNASELLRQIRQHASPFGDGNQRLAHCFADGLEARLAGTGSQIYRGLVSKRRSAADILKAYHLHLAACPFRKMSNFASNKTIMNAAENATRVHVIDFGILYGFQWPTLIQRLSWRSGGPPRLRITGVEFPQPGFRPAERVEETGRRLANYAETFNVPFEYNAIAKNWETIKVEEFKIEPGELIVVNCLYRGKNLHDECVAVNSVRNIFLHLVRKINPDIFIHGIVNGAYNAPFFVTRFREALFHYSAQFDMLETIVPREDRERMLIEKEIFGREALNVIACEGWERAERPETYKQWQVRVMRAGFVQLPFDGEIVERASHKVRSSYHKDFVIDKDRRWLLQGWKGRIIYALSIWKPA